MTGYERAVEWLQGHAPGWKLISAEHRLIESGLVTVELIEMDAYRTGRQAVKLTGEGHSHLLAVQHAVGDLVTESVRTLA